MLSSKIEKALNEQILNENYSSNFYLAMASWCDKQALRGCADFLYGHAEEERMHMMKLLHYVNDAGGHALVPACEQPPNQFKDIEDIFKQTYEHEQKITRDINNLVDLCFEEKDHSSCNFLQWYVGEQHEEEKLFSSILDMIKIAGLDGRGLFLLDKEIGGMTQAPAAGGNPA